MNRLAARFPELARQVVVRRLVVAAVVAAVLHVLVSAGWVTPEWSTATETNIGYGIDILALLTGAKWASRAVTPGDDPRADDGTPLVPVTTLIKTDPVRDSEHGAAVVAGPDLTLDDPSLYPDDVGEAHDRPSPHRPEHADPDA